MAQTVKILATSAIFCLFLASSSGNVDIAALKADIAASLACHRLNPGLAVAVVKDGETLLAEGFGVSDLQTRAPVTNRTLFGVASISKGFAATLLLKLLARRKDVGLQTKVVDILDDFGFEDELRSKHTTLEDILSHRTGLPSYNPIRFDTNLTRADLARRIKHLKTTGQWRGSYIYNNLMYGLVTRIAEVLGGRSWEELVKAELYDPLQMANSGFATTIDFSSPQVATPYQDVKGELQKVDTDFSRRWGMLCGSGCVMTSAADAANWLKFHLSGGLGPSGDRVMAEDDQGQLYVPRTAMPVYSYKYFNRPDVPVTTSLGTYAFGFRVGHYRGHKMAAHSGSTFGYRALLTLLPSEKLGIFQAMTGGDSDFVYRLSLQNYIIDRVLGETPWLNLSSICSFPEPWFNATARTWLTYSNNTQLSRDAQEYEGVYQNEAFGNLEIYYNSTRQQLMAKFGFGRWLLYKQDGEDFFGEGFGIMEIYACRSLIFKEWDASVKKFTKLEVPGFERRSPPMFTRKGFGTSTSASSGTYICLYLLFVSCMATLGY